MSHEKVETNVGVLIFFTIIAISFGALVEIIPLFFLKDTTEPVAGVEPYSPLRLEGRDIYIREGCNSCHSQMIRPFRRAPSGPVRICTGSAAATATNGIACT